MTSKLPRKFLLISAVCIALVTLLVISAVPAMADPPTTTTTTPQSITSTATSTTPTNTSTTTNTTITPGPITASTPTRIKPTVTGVNPNSSNQGTETSVTITGTGFTGVKGVSFGSGIAVTNFTVNGTTEITANIVIANRAFVGSRFVTVATSGGRGTLPAGFSVLKNAPTVTNVAPASGSQGSTLTGITITGTNFTGATGVSFGSGIDVTGFTVNGATQITANIIIANRAFVGSRFVTVIDPSGRGILPAGFTVSASDPKTTGANPDQNNQGQITTGVIGVGGNPNEPSANKPQITGVTPNSGSQGDDLPVTISGTNFTGATGVSFGRGITVSNFAVGNGSTITADITIASNAPNGSRFVTVVGTSGMGTLQAGFNVIQSGSNTNPNSTSTPPVPGSTTTSGTIDAGGNFTGNLANRPQMTSVTPASADQGTTTSVTLTGANFTGTSRVSFGTGIDVTSFTVNSDTQITANIVIANQALVGSRFVTVSTSSGMGIMSAGFNVTKNENSTMPPQPTVTTTIPNSTTSIASTGPSTITTPTTTTPAITTN